MPLTPAHAAAALPIHALARRLGLALPVSALVIGSMAPDFEYLLRLRPRGQFGHTLPGLFLFCLPLGLAAWAAWNALVEPALQRLLPAGLARALQAEAMRPSAGWLPARAALGVLLGAASHDVWDGFTHGDGWGVAWAPVLRWPVAVDLMPGLAWYRLLQHASSAVGLVAILVAAARWARRHPPDARRFAPGQARRSLAVTAAIVGASALGAAANAARGGVWHAPGLAAVGGMAAFAGALLVYGLACRLRPE